MTVRTVLRGIFVAAALAAFTSGALAEFARGLPPYDPKEYDGVPALGVTRAYIPEAVDLSSRMPAPGNQGKIGSCASWATAYAARSYYSLLDSPRTDDSDLIGSPSFLHNVVVSREKIEDCTKTGASLVLAAGVLKGFGLAPLSTYGVDEFCKYEKPLPSEAVASRMKIRDFLWLRGGPNDLNLDAVRQRIALGHPVIFGMKVVDRFQSLAAGEVFERAAGEVPPENSGHAMVAVGYDDRKKAIRILNSWGTGWAEGGYGWISYDTFRRDVEQAITLDTGIAPPKALPNRPGPKIVGRGDDPSCSLVQETSPGVFKGFTADAAQLEAVKQRIAAFAKDHPDFKLIDFDVAIRPWPVCDALLELHEPMAAASVPAIETDGNVTRFKPGDTLGFTVKAPDFPSYLYLVYFQQDGSVVNLLPRNGALRKQTPPHAVMRFGDGKDGRPRYKLGGPAGEEALVLIASRSPIAEIETLEGEGGVISVKAGTPGASPPDVAFLGALRKGRLARPDPQALQREMAAAVLQITIAN